MNSGDLPKYKCHKEVWALKIAAIEFAQDGSAKIAPVDNKYNMFETHKNYRERFKADLHGDDLGYYIQYDGGYQS